MPDAEIETLILANHVEAINGLLYVSGGGWTDHWRPPPGEGQPVISHLGVGLTILVPWAAGAMAHPLAVTIETEDGRPVGQMTTQVNLTRPPGMPVGTDQRAVLALALNLVFPAAGPYRVIARLDEIRTRAVHFRVHDLPAPTPDAPLTS
ncbi:MAG TPA: hypothetical protein VNN74_07430 [Candidatus Micrarchaeia archaeon]|nr:hypothetical protein [Candidatus Micrarchaeia archaeon]